MSLTTDLASLKADLVAEASIAATYSRDATSVSVNILLARQEQKEIGVNDAEITTYEQHVLINPVQLASLSPAEPQPGDQIAFTDASSRAVVLEVNRNREGDCFRMTRSGLWFRVFVKRLVS
jgi:hypothetical protein